MLPIEIEDLAKAAEAAYIRLLSLGEYRGRTENQIELINLRDSIATVRGFEAREVQEDCEEKAFKLRRKEGA